MSNRWRTVLSVVVFVGLVVWAVSRLPDLLSIIALVLLALGSSIYAVSFVAGRGQTDQDAAFREPGDFRVVLQVAGPRPIHVIREVRLTTGRDLVQAKTLVESAPVVVAEEISRASADLVVERLQSSGARAVATGVEAAS